MLVEQQRLEKESALSQEELKNVLRFCNKTGAFYWLKSNGSGVRTGDRAGYTQENGYHRIKINGRLYSEHRLVFLYKYGEFPKNQVDHVNGVRYDNRLENLREVNNSQNQRNSSINHNNKSGCTGVYWNKNNKKWHARIMVNNKNKHLGFFKELEDAISAREKANIKYGYHPNHGKKNNTQT